jgi:hypothetical protein
MQTTRQVKTYAKHNIDDKVLANAFFQVHSNGWKQYCQNYHYYFIIHGLALTFSRNKFSIKQTVPSHSQPYGVG